MNGSDDVIRAMLARARLTDHIEAANWKSVKRQFPGGAFDKWVRALEAIVEADYGAGFVQSFVRASPVCAEKVGTQAAKDLADAAIAVARSSGHAAAGALLAHAPRAAFHLKDGSAFREWLTAIRELAEVAPESVDLVAERSDTLLSRLDPLGFKTWISAGLTSSGADRGKRIAYFSLSDASAVHVMDAEASNVRLNALERPLKAYLTALWKLHPVIRPAATKKALHAPRRASFDRHMIWMPQTFAGFRSEEAKRLFQAAAAHIGAHMVHTAEKFPARSLKPIQIALVSLIEDARVETLAGQEYPGLLRLWRAFHVADVSGPNLAETLMARLSRALIDPDYRDENPWVQKGRTMFHEARPQWDDPDVVRQIGVLLGNDLGQMRVQFNVKTFVVQPPYRDDNTGIWDFGDAPPETADDPDTVYDSVRIEQTEDQDKPHQRERNEIERDEANRAAKVRLVEEDTGIPVARYSEWDYVAGRERPDWTTILEYQPRSAAPEVIDRVLSQHDDVLARITSLIGQAKVSRPTRIRRQPEGERLDLEACVRAVIDRRAGLPPEGRVYESSALRHRDLSVLVLLDISESTKDLIKGTGTSVFSIERAATALLAHAMSGVGDPFAVHAFCSNGRHDVHYYRIKDFDQGYGAVCKGRLAGLRAGLSTRMGAALRHAGTEIAGQVSHRRLVLVITDGEPSDVDVQDCKYFVEDTRKAVHELAHQGIDVFCVGLDSGGDEYLTRIFGRRNVVQIDRVASLPAKLPMIYFRLTA